MIDDDATKRRARELRERSVALTIQALQLQHRATSAIGVSHELLSGLRESLAHHEGLLRSSVELQQSIAAYVKALRHLGEPAERAVEDVRLIADDAIHATRFARDKREALVNQLVLWAIDAFAA